MYFINRKRALAAFSAIGLLSGPALANDTLTVPDASQIKWGLTGNRAYLRNLNDFDSSWIGCCYNYWIDLSTEGGRGMFSAFLTARASRSPIMLNVPSKTTGSVLDMLGNW
jgi:hypothetical protein